MNQLGEKMLLFEQMVEERTFLRQLLGSANFGLNPVDGDVVPRKPVVKVIKLLFLRHC
jgi:hypothetical protein